MSDKRIKAIQKHWVHFPMCIWTHAATGSCPWKSIVDNAKVHAGSKYCIQHWFERPFFQYWPSREFEMFAIETFNQHGVLNAEKSIHLYNW
jgi:hypothetical protein